MGKLGGEQVLRHMLEEEAREAAEASEVVDFLEDVKPGNTTTLPASSLDTTLTDHVWLYILQYLSPEMVLRAMGVSRRWRHMTSDEALWKALCKHAIAVFHPNPSKPIVAAVPEALPSATGDAGGDGRGSARHAAMVAAAVLVDPLSAPDVAMGGGGMETRLPYQRRRRASSEDAAAAAALATSRKEGGVEARDGTAGGKEGDADGGDGGDTSLYSYSDEEDGSSDEEEGDGGRAGGALLKAGALSPSPTARRPASAASCPSPTLSPKLPVSGGAGAAPSAASKLGRGKSSSGTAGSRTPTAPAPVGGTAPPLQPLPPPATAPAAARTSSTAAPTPTATVTRRNGRDGAGGEGEGDDAEVLWSLARQRRLESQHAAAVSASAEYRAAMAARNDMLMAFKAVVASTRSFRAAFRHIPIVRTGGVYTLRHQYVRSGDPTFADVRGILLCVYHRTFRFHPDGTLQYALMAGTHTTALKEFKKARNHQAKAAAEDGSGMGMGGRVSVGWWRLEGRTLKAEVLGAHNVMTRWVCELMDYMDGHNNRLLVKSLLLYDYGAEGAGTPIRQVEDEEFVYCPVPSMV